MKQYCIASLNFTYEERNDHVEILPKYSKIEGYYEQSRNPDNIYYDSYKEAKKIINMLDNEIYVLSNNEYSRPEYYIIDDITADWIKSGRNEDMSNYDWDEAKCVCGECSICIKMMNEQDREYVKIMAEELKNKIEKGIEI